MHQIREQLALLSLQRGQAINHRVEGPLQPTQLLWPALWERRRPPAPCQLRIAWAALLEESNCPDVLSGVTRDATSAASPAINACACVGSPQIAGRSPASLAISRA